MSKINILRTLIMGAPGSGKGTISDRIVKKYDFKYLSMGDILRQDVHKKTKLGIEAKKYMENGQLVPDDLIIKCILSRLHELGSDSWLIDGFPRTLSQAEHFWKCQPVNSVISLHVPHDVIVERVKHRWIHLPSGRVYNLNFNKPKVPGCDDVTGEELVQRVDDKPETVLKRLNTYEACIKPLVDFYRQKGILVEFNGSTSDEIWVHIQKYLDNLVNKDNNF